MKVCFVIYDNDSYIHWFPQGIAYLASVLRKADHDITIYNQDVFHYPESHLIDFLTENHFDVVGVGVIGGYYQYRKLLKEENLRWKDESSVQRKAYCEEETHRLMQQGLMTRSAAKAYPSG